jgi:hypothetical protein
MHLQVVRATPLSLRQCTLGLHWRGFPTITPARLLLLFWNHLLIDAPKSAREIIVELARHRICQLLPNNR